MVSGGETSRMFSNLRLALDQPAHQERFPRTFPPYKNSECVGWRVTLAPPSLSVLQSSLEPPLSVRHRHFNGASVCCHWTPSSFTLCVCFWVVPPVFPLPRETSHLFFIFFAAAAIASSSCNADFMLGKRLVTEGCTQFSSAVLFLKALAEAFILTPLSSFFCSLLVFIKTLGASEYTARLSDSVWVQGWTALYSRKAKEYCFYTLAGSSKLFLSFFN